MGLPHRDYSVSVGSDPDTETDGIMSPEHAVRLWGRSNTKSGRSSCLSSRANSNLTLTDTEHENTENGRPASTSVLVSLVIWCLAFVGSGLDCWHHSNKKIKAHNFNLSWKISKYFPSNLLNTRRMNGWTFWKTEIIRFACHYRRSTNSQIIALLLLSSWTLCESLWKIGAWGSRWN